MTRIPFAAIVLIAGTTLLAQAQAPAQQPPPEKDITVRGCLTQGDTAEVFVLNNGVGESGITGSDLRFRLMPDHDGINIKGHLNQQVQVSGPPDGKPQPPPGRAVPEAEFPTLRVRTISMISNECV